MNKSSNNIDILPISVDGLNFSVGGKDILCDLNFQLDAGIKTFIIGPNGAGKTVLLKLCHGLLVPASGKIVWANRLKPKPHYKQGMLFQRPILLRRSTRANIEYALAVQGVHGLRQKSRVDAVLEETGLAELAHRNARVLSLGEQQRLALARVWALKPQILFLDEPTAHLDPSSTRMVERIISRIFESGTKIVMTSHDMGQVKRLADEVLFLHRGHMLEKTPVEQFFSDSKNKEVSLFVKGNLLW